MTGLPMFPKAPSTPSEPAGARPSGPVEVAVRPTGAVNALPPSSVDSSSPEAFIRGIAPYAVRVSQATGIPAEVLIGMAANETGFGKYAHGNNLFGIKGTGPAGSFNSQTWEDYGQGAVTINDNFRAYHSPAESLLDFAKLVMTSPRYAPAMGQTSVEGFVGALRRGGYMTDPDYVQKINNITTRYSGVIKESLRTSGTTPDASGAIVASGRPAPAPAAAVGKGVIVPDQFGVGLPADEAYAACGPMAAVAFAQAYGRNPTPQEAMDLAKQSGWTAAGGMNGVGNQKRLLDKMGIPARLETNIDWEHVKADAINRHPVIVSTPGHYFVVDGYDQRTGAYHVGQSGKAYRGGAEWMTPAQIGQLAGAPHGALYTENPLAQQPSVASPAARQVTVLPAQPVAPAAPAAPAVPVRPVAPTPPPPKPVEVKVNAPLPPQVNLPAPAQPQPAPAPQPVVNVPPIPTPQPIATPAPAAAQLQHDTIAQEPLPPTPTPTSPSPPPKPVPAPPPVQVVATPVISEPQPLLMGREAEHLPVAPKQQPVQQQPVQVEQQQVQQQPAPDRTVALDQPNKASGLALGALAAQQTTPKPPEVKKRPRRSDEDE